MISEGQLVDLKYRLVARVGEGGMGTVFEARHVSTNRRVAVKVISKSDLASDPAVVARFEREARAAGSIDTEHIADVLDAGLDEATGTPYIVMEYLVGEDLQQIVRRLGPLPPDLALRIVAQACAGLAKAHEARVVHRDIKPANIFLANRDDGQIVVKLVDFGVAKMRREQPVAAGEASLTHTGSILGSPVYMSPEQAIGSKSVDHRADIWALGVVLYEALTGRAPHQHHEAFGRLVIAICQETPTPIQEVAPWVPPAIAEIANTAMRIDVAQRYPSARAMLDAILTVLPNESAIRASMVSAISKAERATVRPRLVVTGNARRGGLDDTLASSSASPTDAPVTLSRGGKVRVVARRTLAIGAVAALVFGVAAYGRSLVHEQPVAPVAAAARPSAPPTLPSATLAISPSEASVQIDGEPAVVTSGSVALRGAVGSVHSVRVTLGDRAVDATVAITELGPIPARVELDAPAALSASATPPIAHAPAGTPPRFKPIAPVAPPSAAPPTVVAHPAPKATAPPALQTSDKFE
jgi:eukaryotic-like serine/threonine-protein kinase